MEFSSQARSVSVAPSRVRFGGSDLEGVVRALQEERPDLDRGSWTFAAAVVLLTGRTVEHNVDKISRRTRLPRDFVARCARRLHDNGVWKKGLTCASWHTPGSDEFWADVAVAEGKLSRRIDEDGEVRWVEPGEVWKRLRIEVANLPCAPELAEHEEAAPAPADPHPARTPPELFPDAVWLA